MFNQDRTGHPLSGSTVLLQVTVRTSDSCRSAVSPDDYIVFDMDTDIDHPFFQS